MNTPSSFSFRERLVSSPVYFPYWPLEKVLATCRDLGFHKFEGFSEWPDCKLDWRGDPAVPRRLAESMGLQFTSFHLPAIRGDEAAGLDKSLTAARYAAGLGAKIVIFKAINREIFGRVTKNFLDALDQTGLGLIPVVQNHKGTPISDLDDYREVFESIGNDPRLKAILEVGHFQRAGISWKTGWDYLGDRVALIHVNDIRNDESVLFGSGEVDFRGLIRQVKASGYQGDIVVELELASRESNPQETIDGVRDAVTLLEKYYQGSMTPIADLAFNPSPVNSEPATVTIMTAPASITDPRLCIIGAGGLSSNRIYPYIGAAGAQLAGVCDLDEEKAARNARRFGGVVYNDFKKMLAEQKPDGVMISVGPKAHAQLATEVMRLGYPVYTEKPPAESAASALEVARVAKETGLLCTTAFKKRYSTANVRAKEWMEKFTPENFLSLSIDYCSGHYENKTPSGMFLLDFAIHIIDLTIYLFGEVESVFAFTRDHHAYGVSLRFANGAVGTLNLTDGRAWDIPTEEVEITLSGGNFMTIHNSSVWRITESGKAIEWREPATYTARGDSGRETGHLAEIEDFVAALKEKRTTTRSSIYESYKSMVLHAAIRASAESGQVVRTVYEPL